MSELMYLVMRVIPWDSIALEPTNPLTPSARILPVQGVGIGFCAVFDTPEAAAAFCNDRGYTTEDVVLVQGHIAAAT